MPLLGADLTLVTEFVLKTPVFELKDLQICLRNKPDCVLKDGAASKILDHVRFIQTDLLCNAPCPRKLEAMKTRTYILRSSLTAYKK